MSFQKLNQAKIVSLVDKLLSLNEGLNSDDKNKNQRQKLQDEISKTSSDLNDLVFRFYDYGFSS